MPTAISIRGRAGEMWIKLRDNLALNPLSALTTQIMSEMVAASYRCCIHSARVSYRILQFKTPVPSLNLLLSV